MARLRTAPTAHNPPVTTTAAASAPKARQALKEKTNTTRTRAHVYENDGNTEDLVKDARPRRGRLGAAPQAPEEFVMTGALGNTVADENTLDRAVLPSTTDELAKSDAPPPPTSKANRRPPRMTRKVQQDEAQSHVVEGVKKRMQAATRKQAAPTRRSQRASEDEDDAPSSDSLPTKPPAQRQSASSGMERSDFSLSPSPTPPGTLNSVSKQRSSIAPPGSALRSNGTPAVESSILALKNFKRRPRQPSMLQMVQQRTASARPSAVHTDDIEDPSVFDVDNVEDDVEDFEPEAEGTPLRAMQKPPVNTKKASKQSHQKQPKTAEGRPQRTAQKRKSDHLDQSLSALDALKAKRQKPNAQAADGVPLDGVQNTLSVHQTSPEQQLSTPPLAISEVQVVNSSPSSTPATEPSSKVRRHPAFDDDIVVPSTGREADDNDISPAPPDSHWHDEGDAVANGTMAEPASSSPPPPEAPTATQRTDIMADPSTQPSPPRSRREKFEKQKRKPAPMTTATLQSLLPKRRQPAKPRKRKSEYDIDSASEDDSPLETTHLDGDEDELSGNLRRQTKSKTPAKTKKGKGIARSKGRQSKTPALSTRKSSAPAPSRKSTATGRKQTKTYGKAATTTSDKENENDDDAFEDLDENDESALPDTSMSMYEAAQSKELEAAKKKFARIDDYEMEFESMSFEEHRSSSQGWR